MRITSSEISEGTDRFLANGGKITPLNSIDNGRSRVKANKDRKPRKQPQKIKDEMCSALSCPNLKTCKYLCPVLSFIDGNKEATEKVARQAENDHQAQNDYNQTLYDMMKQKELGREKILGIKDIKVKAIASLLWLEFSQTEIAAIMHVDRSTIYRYSMQHIKSTNNTTKTTP